jgi:integrase
MASYRQSERTGKWSFVIDIGSDELGERNQKTFSKDAYGKPLLTEKEARDYCKKIEDDLKRGRKFEAAELGPFITKYFQRVVVEEIAETTYDTQWNAVSNHIIPYIGKLKVDKITDDTIEKYYDKIMEKGVTRATIRIIAMVLSKTFRYAQKKRLIMDNPMKLVDTPSYKPKKQNIWSPEQVDQFLDSCKESNFYNLYVLAESTGMRRGELVGLTWPDVNIMRGTVTINQAVKYSKKSGKHIGSTKTEEGRRTISIPSYAVKALLNHKLNQMEGCTVVFDSLGEHYQPGHLSKRFKSDCAASGLPMITIHGLRHAHATYLLSNGYSVAQVAERLGDKKETIMMTYAHVLPNAQKDIAAHLDRRKAVDKSKRESVNLS